MIGIGEIERTKIGCAGRCYLLHTDHPELSGRREIFSDPGLDLQRISSNSSLRCPTIDQKTVVEVFVEFAGEQLKPYIMHRRQETHSQNYHREKDLEFESARTTLITHFKAAHLMSEIVSRNTPSGAPSYMTPPRRDQGHRDCQPSDRVNKPLIVIGETIRIIVRFARIVLGPGHALTRSPVKARVWVRVQAGSPLRTADRTFKTSFRLCPPACCSAY